MLHWRDGFCYIGGATDSVMLDWPISCSKIRSWLWLCALDREMFECLIASLLHQFQLM
ncbi:hypothetical protein HanPSC8_Chr15g0658201 [Helianthus annuus]|nr:hypothetical protein HanPSC8_Chr15g0658201 [Helianthus annuus]